MNIKQKLREALKKQKREYDYGCVMATLDLDKKKWSAVQDMVEDNDLYLGEEGESHGRELDPHVTILYGIHSDVADADVEALIDEIEKIDMTLYKVSIFENDEFDVLKYDVKSPDLSKLNTKFKTLPHTSTYPDYHAHATIAYLKKSKGKEYIEKMKDIEPIELISDEILYSKANKEKKKYKI